MLGMVIVPGLRAIRVQRALSQDELAHRAGVDRKTIMRAEAGGKIRFVSVRRLAAALHVSLARLQRPPEPESD